MSVWDVGSSEFLSYGLKSLSSGTLVTFSLLQPRMAQFCFVNYCRCLTPHKWKTWTKYKLCKSGMLRIHCMSAEYYLTFVLGTFWTSWPWTGSSCPFGTEPVGGGTVSPLKQQWECVKKGLVGVILRVKWIEVRIQFPELSCIPQQGVCLIGDALFFPPLSLFICALSVSARKRGQAGYCHCNLLCRRFAKDRVCACVFIYKISDFFNDNILYQKYRNG